MVARFIAAPSPGWPHRLEMGEWQAGQCPLASLNQALGIDAPTGLVELHCGEWPLDIGALREMQQRLSNQGQPLQRLITNSATTLVAAKALGINCEVMAAPLESTKALEVELLVHRGTLRAGDHLESEGSVLVLGDVNPGARISAANHVLVWGRLRGIAHAGCYGNSEGRIIALQLRPLQLRIADAIARGPEELPPDGLCEQAELINGEIRINPAAATVPAL